MKQSIVLIEIENGMIQVYADKNVLVATHDYDTEGNDLGRIDRENNDAAFQELTKKLELVNSADANKALAVLESRDTTDWSLESWNVGYLEGKAKHYMGSVIPSDGVFVGGLFIYGGGESSIEVRHVEIGNDGRIILNDVDIRPIHQSFVSSCDWIELASLVQKAIAGGAKA